MPDTAAEWTIEMTTRRYSAQRKIIENALCGTNEHPTAESIYNMLKRDYPNLSLGTVYRNLSNLVSEGLARKMDFSVERYDANVGAHDHFICGECGRVYDIDCESTIDISAVSENSGHQIKERETLFRGICKNCREA